MIIKARVREVYHCEHCGLDLYVKKDHENHIKMYHEGFVDFGCEECDVTFKDKMELEGHMKMLHH